MWYVKELLCKRPGEECGSKVSFFNLYADSYEDTYKPGGGLRVTVCEAETGVVEVFAPKTAKDARRYALSRPILGIGVLSAEDAPKSNFLITFAVVIELSRRFRECVKGMTLVPYEDESDLEFEDDYWWENQFWPVDEGDSLMFNGLIHPFHPPVACTLFNIMCYFPGGWIGDAYYVHAEQGFERVKSVGGFMYTKGRAEILARKYEFSDLSRVRSLVAKATVFGFNPLQKHFEG